MRNVLFTFAIMILILSACGKTNVETGGVTTDSPEETNIQSEEIEDNEDSDLELSQGFSPYKEINDFTIAEETFAALNDFAQEDNDGDYVYQPGIDSFDYAIKEDDGTIYYLDFISKDPGFEYVLFTLDENNQAIVVADGYIHSPTDQKLADADEYYFVRKSIMDDILVLKFDYGEDYDNETQEVTVETFDIRQIFETKEKEYETEVALEKTFIYIEDEVDDSGEVVNSTAGPVFVYFEDPENDTEIQMIPLSNKLDEEIVLNDPHKIVEGSTDIIFINFEEGFYFSHDYFDEGFKRLEIESGEPLYDDAYDKVLPYDRTLIDYVYPIDNIGFYVIDDSNHKIYVISNDLDMIDFIFYFESEYEMEDYDGTVSGPHYLGNNQFLMVDQFEYQRKERVKLFVTEYSY